MLIRILGFAASILVGTSGTVSAAYDVVQIQARSNFGDGFNLPAGSSFNSGSPDLNDDGSVAFRLVVVGGTNSAGLWVGGHGNGDVVYTSAPERLITDPTINEGGAVAFEPFDIGLTDGVFVFDPISGTSTMAVAPGGVFGIERFGGPTITDTGVIGFRADRGSTNAYIFDDAGAQTQVAFEGGEGIGFLFVPQFDNARRFVAKVRLGGTGEDLPDEIRRYAPNGTFQVLAADDDSDPGSPFTRFSNGVGVSPGGITAFTASIAGGTGVFRTDGVSITEIATTAHADVSSIDFFRPVVNDFGQVAFRAFDAAGLRVIYVGDGGDLVRIVGEHDLIPTDLGTARVDQNDSSPVFGGHPAINERGDVAFAATLTPPDNDQVEWGTGMFVAYADAPVSVPTSFGDPTAAHFHRPAPNPFHLQTELVLALPTSGVVAVVIFDASGRRVRTLARAARVTETLRTTWDGRRDDGVRAAPGVYFVRATGHGIDTSQRIVRR